MSHLFAHYVCYLRCRKEVSFLPLEYDMKRLAIMCVLETDFIFRALLLKRNKRESVLPDLRLVFAIIGILFITLKKLRIIRSYHVI